MGKILGVFRALTGGAGMGPLRPLSLPYVR